MPSPFPGMDPFIEGQGWTGFHARFIVQLETALVPLVVPRYVTYVEERVYLEHQPEEVPHWIRPDVAVAEQESPASQGRGGTAVLEAPAVVPVVMPERRREPYLEIRLREGGELVTVIELLSPTNKRPGSDGYREYRQKRQAVLMSEVHLVELDLLRGGERLPMARPLPRGDYYAIISRAAWRPDCQVWFWGLRESLRRIPIPLREPDEDAELDLQAVFNAVYDSAGYAFSLRYHQEVVPPLDEKDVAWALERLAQGPGSSLAG